jgi:kumamolisin
MVRSILPVLTAGALLLSAFTPSAAAQRRSHGEGRVMIPHSSLKQPGKRARTMLRVFVPAEGLPLAGPPFAGYAYETPASIACVYGLVRSKVAGCNPNTAVANPRGGMGAVALVDAYDDPYAASDLAAFSKQFGLKQADFKVVFSGGKRPPQDPTGGWELEEALDIEWAHAMAPDAKIFLVEAPSNEDNDLLSAVDLASRLVARAGGGQVSMSWGGDESADELQLDSFFTTPGVVYFASSGDAPGVIYPGTSPNVVSAGGTTLSRSPFTGDFIRESPWTETGGGVSEFEPRPSYQNGIASIIGDTRGVPDISFDANPDTGVWVLDSLPVDGQGGPGSWWVVGGTSVSSPALAGIVNSTRSRYPSTESELTVVYSNLGVSSDFNDTATGYCGPYAGYFAETGWDPCTGVGSVNGKQGK